MGKKPLIRSFVFATVLLVCLTSIPHIVRALTRDHSPENQQADEPILDLDGRIFKLSISPDEKFGAVVLGPPNYLLEPFESRKLVVFELATKKVVAEREFELGLNDVAIFNDRVYAISNPPNRALELDLKELKTLGRIRFEQPIKEIAACGDSYFVLAGKSKIGLFKRGQVNRVAEVNQDLKAKRDRDAPIQKPVEIYDGLVRMYGAWFDLESGKVVALNSPMGFFDLGQGSPRYSHFTWGVPRTSRDWSQMDLRTRPSGPVISWRFPCIFNVVESPNRIDAIDLKLEIRDALNGKKIGATDIGSAKCLANLSVSRQQIEWSLELGKKHVYVAKERSVFKVLLPRNLPNEPIPHFPIRQPKIVAKQGEVVSFSVALESKDTALEPRNGYGLKSLTPGVDLDRSSGKVVVDTALVWQSLEKIITNSQEDFTPQKIEAYQKAYHDLTNESTNEIPMLIQIPVTARLRDAVISTAYCLLLMVSQDEVMSRVSASNSKKSQRQQDRERQTVNKQLEEKLRESDRKLDSLEKKIDSTWKDTNIKIVESTKQINDLVKEYEAIENDATESLKRLDGVEELKRNLENKVRLLDGEFGEAKNQLQDLRKENEELQLSSLITRLIGIGSAVAVVFAGIICYLIVVARKIQL